jgi:hypothetical protein
LISGMLPSILVLYHILVLESDWYPRRKQMNIPGIVASYLLRGVGMR